MYKRVLLLFILGLIYSNAAFPNYRQVEVENNQMIFDSLTFDEFYALVCDSELSPYGLNLEEIENKAKNYSIFSSIKRRDDTSILINFEVHNLECSAVIFRSKNAPLIVLKIESYKSFKDGVKYTYDDILGRFVYFGGEFLFIDKYLGYGESLDKTRKYRTQSSLIYLDSAFNLKSGIFFNFLLNDELINSNHQRINYRVFYPESDSTVSVPVEDSSDNYKPETMSKYLSLLTDTSFTLTGNSGDFVYNSFEHKFSWISSYGYLSRIQSEICPMIFTKKEN